MHKTNIDSKSNFPYEDSYLYTINIVVRTYDDVDIFDNLFNGYAL